MSSMHRSRQPKAMWGLRMCWSRARPAFRPGHFSISCITATSNATTANPTYPLTNGSGPATTDPLRHTPRCGKRDGPCTEFDSERRQGDLNPSRFECKGSRLCCSQGMDPVARRIAEGTSCFQIINAWAKGNSGEGFWWLAPAPDTPYN